MRERVADQDQLIRSILGSVRTIAVVGASPKPERASNSVAAFLKTKGYRIFPINPGHVGRFIVGEPVFARLADVPVPIDMVDIFRRSEAAGEVVEEALRLTQLPRAIWMQLGIVDEAAAARAQDAGMDVVMDHCPKIAFYELGLTAVA